MELLYVITYGIVICIGLCICLTFSVQFSSVICVSLFCLDCLCLLMFSTQYLFMSFNVFSSVYVFVIFNCSVSYIDKKVCNYLYHFNSCRSLDPLFLSLLLSTEFVKLTPNLAPQMMRR